MGYSKDFMCQYQNNVWQLKAERVRTGTTLENIQECYNVSRTKMYKFEHLKVVDVETMSFLCGLFGLKLKLLL